MAAGRVDVNRTPVAAFPVKSTETMLDRGAFSARGERMTHDEF
jgi:hypothetical protein